MQIKRICALLCCFLLAAALVSCASERDASSEGARSSSFVSGQSSQRDRSQPSASVEAASQNSSGNESASTSDNLPTNHDDFTTLQQSPEIQEDDIKRLAEGLLSRALNLCYLAQLEIYDTGELVYDRNNKENQIVKEGATYSRVTELPYQNTQEMWDDIYSVFRKETGGEQFQFLFQSLYTDIEGSLYVNTSVDALGKQRDWNVDTLTVEAVTDGTISLQMDVQLRENKAPATLEIVYENGRWVLNETYFAVFNEGLYPD